MGLNGIGEASVFSAVDLSWVVFRGVHDDERSRSLAFVADWVVVDPCFSE